MREREWEKKKKSEKKKGKKKKKKGEELFLHNLVKGKALGCLFIAGLLGFLFVVKHFSTSTLAADALASAADEQIQVQATSFPLSPPPASCFLSSLRSEGVIE